MRPAGPRPHSQMATCGLGRCRRRAAKGSSAATKAPVQPAPTTKISREAVDPLPPGRSREGWDEEPLPLPLANITMRSLRVAPGPEKHTLRREICISDQVEPPENFRISVICQGDFFKFPCVLDVNLNVIFSSDTQTRSS